MELAHVAGMGPRFPWESPWRHGGFRIPGRGADRKFPKQPEKYLKFNKEGPPEGTLNLHVIYIYIYIYRYIRIYPSSIVPIYLQYP